MRVKSCRFGNMMYLENDQFIGCSLDTYGESHYCEVEVYRQLVQRGVLVDVGANIGMITVPLAQTAESVIAIEANTFIYHMLCGNVALNNLQNVRALNLVAAEASGLVGYHSGLSFDGIQNYGSFHVSSGCGSTDECGRRMDKPVLTVAIDNLGVVPTLIKIDVEGMEVPVLLGARKTIERHKPYLSIEFLSDTEGIIDFLQQINYKWKLLATPVFNELNFAGVKENVLMVDGKHIYSHNLLCWPQECVFEFESPWLMELNHEWYPRP